MATATARAPQPGNKKGRPARRPVSKLNIHSNSDISDTASLLRLQRLFSLGISGTRADVIASIAWEAGA